MISMAGCTLQEQGRQVNGWVCMSTATCVRVCQYLKQGGAESQLKEENQPQQFLDLLWIFF